MAGRDRRWRLRVWRLAFDPLEVWRWVLSNGETPGKRKRAHWGDAFPAGIGNPKSAYSACSRRLRLMKSTINR